MNEAGETAAVREKAVEWETRHCGRALKRARAFEALCKKEGIRLRPLVLKNINPKISPQMMKWRRITSITLRLEPFMDDLERKAGLERLVGWLERAYSQWKKGDGGREGAESTEGAKEGRGETANALAGRQNAGDTAGGTPALHAAMALKNAAGRDRMIQADWNWDVKAWARVRQDGFSVESICANLGISRWKLTQLVKEHCNLTANELIDGFKLKHLKGILLERLRTAARQLWGSPGQYAAYKTEGFLNCEGERAVSPVSESKRSAYFKTRAVDLFNERRDEERIRRIGDLMKRLWRDFDLESWAVSAGFASAGKLKRAVLMVLGKSLPEVERKLATEVFEYYRCAEDRELRNLALRENTNPAVFRAREMYHGKEDRPQEPFLDEWSAALFGEKDWVERMMGVFG